MVQKNFDIREAATSVPLIADWPMVDLLLGARGSRRRCGRSSVDGEEAFDVRGVVANRAMLRLGVPTHHRGQR